jgi:hypothetical protein
MSRARALLTVVSVGVLLSGCANPDAPALDIHRREGAGSPGEPPAPPAPAPAAEHSAAPQSTAAQGVEKFTGLYTNWDYRTLAAHQRTLAAISVGAARLLARRTAASAEDRQVMRARVWNRGVILAVAPDRARPGWWVIVTREQTGGSGEYESLPPTSHVTLALAVRVRSGWAVSEWQPQS